MENNLIDPTDILKGLKGLIKTLEGASKPSCPENDNRKTGLWKGVAITAGVAAIGFGVIAFEAVKTG